MVPFHDNQDLYNIVIGDKYVLLGKIGKGGYGVIHLGVDRTNNDERVAVKVEPLNTPNPSALFREKEVYKTVQGSLGIPKVRWFGQVRGYHVLVMDLLGPSLEHLFDYCSRKFSMSTIVMIADQIISRLLCVHSKGLIHCDVKPENILIGGGFNDGILFLIDFGLAHWYCNPVARCHIPFRGNRPFVGTTVFSSVNSNLLMERSRRDDLECLGYNLIYFINGDLPWRDLKYKIPNKKQRYDRTAEMKMSISIEELCKNNTCLRFPMMSFFKYCRNLRFDETPNYSYLQTLFIGQLYSCQPSPNYSFDWTELRRRGHSMSQYGAEGNIVLGPYGYPKINLYF